VVNYDLPNEPEAYVHRIGRTARAGADGKAVSLCDPSERAYLRDIQRLIRLQIPEHPDHPYVEPVRGLTPVGADAPSQPQPEHRTGFAPRRNRGGGGGGRNRFRGGRGRR
jgi:ATP-dependent RNA helicase RhlE